MLNHCRYVQRIGHLQQRFQVCALSVLYCADYSAQASGGAVL